MVDQQLIAYVRQQRQAGYSDDRISSALRRQGYPESLISSVLIASSASDTKNDKAVLEGYVHTYLDQGYTGTQVKEWLHEQGYGDKEIERALRKAKRPTTRKKSSHSILLFPFLAILLMTGGYFLFTSDLLDPQPAPTGAVAPQPGTTSFSEIIDNLIPMAQNNPEGALALCTDVVLEDRSRCILTVSRESRNPGLCTKIEDDWTRDQCYLNPFIYDGHLQYCERLTLESNVAWCDKVRRLTGDPDV